MKKLAEGVLVASGLLHGLQLFGVNLLQSLASLASWLPMLVYALAGLSALYLLVKMFK